MCTCAKTGNLSCVTTRKQNCESWIGVMGTVKCKNAKRYVQKCARACVWGEQWCILGPCDWMAEK